MLSKLLGAAIFAAGLALPNTAAASGAIVTADLNMRIGPGTQYSRMRVIPSGTPIHVLGCQPDYWCDVVWAGRRGWVAGDYLAFDGPGYVAQPRSVYVEPPIINVYPPYWRDRPPKWDRPRPPHRPGWDRPKPRPPIARDDRRRRPPHRPDDRWRRPPPKVL